MGLKEVIQRAALRAVKSTGNLRTSVVYHSSGVSDYSTASGVSVETGAVDYPLDDAILTSFTLNEISRSPGMALVFEASGNWESTKILVTDHKLLVPSLSLPTTPKPSDYILLDQKKVSILKLFTDPAHALYIFQLRS